MYSDAHLQAARALFPQLVGVPSWLDQPWTEEEINRCKQWEWDQSWAVPPTLDDVVGRYLSGQSIASYCDDVLQWYERVLPPSPVGNLLSVGCGYAFRELALVARGRCTQAVGLDNSPITPILHRVLQPAVAERMTLMRGDCLLLPFSDKSFDIVVSHAVAYSLPDELLPKYFSELLRVTKRGGRCLVSEASNISPLYRAQFLFAGSSRPAGWKQTGWSRDARHLRGRFPSTAAVVRTVRFRHNQLPSMLRNEWASIGRALAWASAHWYPCIHSVIGFELLRI